jgi:hypothetical protein
LRENAMKLHGGPAMACEILKCCQFFNDKMKGLPKTAEYIKNKICLGEYESCARFRIFKEFRGGHIPLEFHPDDTEEVQKVMQCLHNKNQSKE